MLKTIFTEIDLYMYQNGPCAEKPTAKLYVLKFLKMACTELDLPIICLSKEVSNMRLNIVR